LTENVNSTGDVDTQLCDDSGCLFEMMQMSVTGCYTENYSSQQRWTNRIITLPTVQVQAKTGEWCFV